MSLILRKVILLDDILFFFAILFILFSNKFIFFVNINFPYSRDSIDLLK